MADDNPYAKFKQAKENPFAKFKKTAQESSGDQVQRALASKDAPGYGERALTQLKQSPILTYPQDALSEQRSSVDQAKTGFKQAKDGPGWWDRTKGVGNMAMGAAGAVYAPVTAGVHALVGEPVKRVTGSEKLGQGADFAANLGLPAPLGLRGASKVPKVGASMERAASPLVNMVEGAHGGFQKTFTPESVESKWPAWRFPEKPQSPTAPTAARGLPKIGPELQLTAKPTIDQPGTKVAPLPQGMMPPKMDLATRSMHSQMPPELGPAQHAAALIRKETGMAAFQTGLTGAKLEKFATINSTMAETDKLDLIDYLQTGKAPKGGTPIPEVQELRGVFQAAEGRLKGLPKGDQMKFKEWYFPNKWEQAPGKTAFSSGLGKEGSGAFLKQQKMTMKEGMEAGFKPRTTDPLQATMEYEANVNRFIATQHIFDQARRSGIIHYLRSREAPPEGWVEIGGRIGRGAGGGSVKAYAPEGWARIYNNYVSQGFDRTDLGDIYKFANRANNSMIGMKLGLSGYHALMETVYEAPTSEVARGIGATAGGQLRTGAKAISTGLVPGAAPLKQYTAGRTMEHLAKTGEMKGQLFSYTGLSPEAKTRAKDILDIYVKAGGRPLGARGSTLGEFEYGKPGNGPYFKPSIKRYTDAFRQGTNKVEALLSPAKDVVHSVTRVAGEIGKDFYEKPGIATIKAAAKQIGRVMETTAYPIFDKYIPRLKTGAFTEQMSTWMAGHPEATHEQTMVMARQFVDSIDNRFGEMVKDNIFMKTTMKQALQLATVSYSYELGTIRELGGGGKDMLTGKGLTPRAQYVLALPIVTGTTAAMYQYMKTGKPPESPMDLLAPRTGGKNQRGEDERVSPIGYSKDLYRALTDPSGWAGGKLNPMVQTGRELASGKDWKGDPIAPQKPGQDALGESTEWLKAMLGHVAEAYTPITADSFKNKPAGSNISGVESAAGLRPAGMQYTNPQGLAAFLKKKQQQEWQNSQRKKAKEEVRSRTITKPKPTEYGGE